MERREYVENSSLLRKYHFNEMNNQLATISLIILVKNSENSIKKCILSGIQYFDEIIVVDTGSTDQTLSCVNEIKSDKVKVYLLPWEDDFSLARNKAISYATKQWVCFIDSDEYFDPDIMNLRDVLTYFNQCESRKQITLSYNINEVNRDYTYKLIPRILLRNGSCSYRGRVHETVYYKNREADIIQLRFNAFHTGYSEENAFKKKRNVLLLKKMLEESFGLRWFYFYVRDGKGYLDFEKYNGAFKKLFCLTSVDDLLNSEYGHEILLQYCQWLIENNKLNDAEILAEKLMKKYCDEYDSIYLYFLTKLFLHQKILNDELNKLVSFRKKNNGYKMSEYNCDGYHIDMLIGQYCYYLEDYDCAYQYFVFLKNKLDIESQMQKIIEHYLGFLQRG